MKTCMQSKFEVQMFDEELDQSCCVDPVETKFSGTQVPNSEPTAKLKPNIPLKDLLKPIQTHNQVSH